MGVLVVACAASAQPAAEPPPLDVNAIQPQPTSTIPASDAGQTGAKAAADAAAEAGTDAAAQPDAEAAPAPVEDPFASIADGAGNDAAVLELDGVAIPISGFRLEYSVEPGNPEAPALADLSQVRVRLKLTSTGYVAPELVVGTGANRRVIRELGGSGEVDLSIAEIAAGSPANFHLSAIRAVGSAIKKDLQERGFIGMFIEPNADDLIVTSLTEIEDLRAGERSELRLRIWMPSVSMVRTQASGDRLKSQYEGDPTQRINSPDPVHTRIRNQSPVQQGSLLRKNDLDDFVFRLNRHPGRRADIAIGAGENPDEVVLDYLVTETKPWSAYAQLSNTGTRQTSEWRQRLGFVHNQLTAHDDILRLDYITSNFDSSHTFNVQYDFPVISDRMRLKLGALYSEFTASDVGSSGEFTGDTYGANAELSANVYQHREFFLDAVGGVRWNSNRISNSLNGTEGEGDFVYPFLGVRAERFTDASSFSAGLVLEVLVPELTGLEPEDFEDLGRSDPSSESQVLKFSAEQSFYLEPLINPRGYAGESNDGLATLAHEIAFSTKGQYSFGDRLIASEEDVAGGLFSVRGYPESVVAADTVAVVSAEYRFHLPQALGIDWDGAGWKTHNPGTWLGEPVSTFGPDFRYTPQQPFGRADWDLVFRGFFDAAFRMTEGQVAGEDDEPIYGTGIGVEFQWKRNILMRVDWGVALSTVGDPDSVDPAIVRDSVDSGDNRFHFLFTVLY